MLAGFVYKMSGTSNHQINSPPDRGATEALCCALRLCCPLEPVVRRPPPLLPSLSSLSALGNEQNMFKESESHCEKDSHEMLRYNKKNERTKPKM